MQNSSQFPGKARQKAFLSQNTRCRGHQTKSNWILASEKLQRYLQVPFHPGPTANPSNATGRSTAAKVMSAAPSPKEHWEGPGNQHTTSKRPFSRLHRCLTSEQDPRAQQQQRTAQGVTPEQERVTLKVRTSEHSRTASAVQPAAHMSV